MNRSLTSLFGNTADAATDNVTASLVRGIGSAFIPGKAPIKHDEVEERIFAPAFGGNPILTDALHALPPSKPLPMPVNLEYVAGKREVDDAPESTVLSRYATSPAPSETTSTADTVASGLTDSQLLTSYHAAIAEMKGHGIKHLMTIKTHRVVHLNGVQRGKLSLLKTVSLFNYQTGMVAEQETTTGLFADNTIPTHVWYVACLLTGEQPTATVFKMVIDKWRAICDMVLEMLEDKALATEMISHPLNDHAFNADVKYIQMLILDDSVRFNRPRLTAMEVWMKHLHDLTSGYMAFWIAQQKINTMTSILADAMHTPEMRMDLAGASATDAEFC